MSDSKDNLKCALCGSRLIWMPISRAFVCESCRQSFDERAEVYLRHKTKSTIGNAAAMREALHELKEMFRDIDLAHDSLEKEIYELANAALSAPARNCDRYEDASSAYADFIVQWKLDGHLDDVPTLKDFANWLLAPASERKGE